MQLLSIVKEGAITFANALQIFEVRSLLLQSSWVVEAFNSLVVTQISQKLLAGVGALVITSWLSGHVSESLELSVVVVIGCGVDCGHFKHVTTISWNYDPIRFHIIKTRVPFAPKTHFSAEASSIPLRR